MKRFVVAILFFLLLASVFAYTKTNNLSVLGEAENKLVVKTTSYPLYFFTEKIVGDKLDIQCIIPPGVEPHSWEPTPGDLVKLEKTDLLIYNGAGLEEWIIEITNILENKRLILVDASIGLNLIQYEEDEHEHSDELISSHDQEEYDPHIWLDPVNSQKIVINILEAIIKIDSHNKEFFEANAHQLVLDLQELDETYRKELKETKRKEFVVNHAAFGYLANRYGLNQIAVMGINPHIEPTPRKLAELVNLLREHNLKYVFTETMVSSRVAEVLAYETGLSTRVLNPLGNLTKDDILAGKDYFTIMHENLFLLKEALN
ncbi:MAG: hypothetical protein JM58_18310 [Peptococcaceae bacterium BICA1-8]|nr:MAG: hypothetical protein JM58_18310 [Peptococcaceae bacterium BICA1-8]